MNETTKKRSFFQNALRPVLKPLVKVYVEAKTEVDQEKNNSESQYVFLAIISILPLAIAVIKGDGIVIAFIEHCAENCVSKVAKGAIKIFKEAKKECLHN